MMNLTCVTTVYNHYDPFLLEWCRSVAEAGVAHAVVALGRNHGVSDSLRSRCMQELPGLLFVEDGAAANFGTLRNTGVRAAETEWAQIVDVDDRMLPGAMGQYADLQDTADVIIPAMTMVGVGGEKDWCPVLPVDIARGLRRPWLGNCPVFRVELWRRNPFEDHAWCGYPFFAGMVELNARFGRTGRPCVKYVKWEGSHSGRYLGKRSTPADPKAKRAARRHKAEMKRRIVDFYRQQEP